MTLRSQRELSAWRQERLAWGNAPRHGGPSTAGAAIGRTAAHRDDAAASEDAVAVGIVNYGRQREGLAPLAMLPYLGPEQPRAERIDAVKLAAAIVEAGRRARGELPVPLPADPVARAIVVAGERAAGRAADIGPARLEHCPVNEKLDE
jgi:hypothetical protein